MRTKSLAGLQVESRHKAITLAYFVQCPNEGQ